MFDRLSKEDPMQRDDHLILLTRIALWPLAGAAVIWPWELTPLMSRVIGGWIMFLGVGGLVLYFEPRYSAYRALIPSVLVWDIALLVGSLLHLDNFDFSRTSPWVWFITLVVLILGNIALLLRFEPLYRQR